MIMSSFLREIGMKPRHGLVGSSVQVSAAKLQVIRRDILAIRDLALVRSQDVIYIFIPST